MSGEEEYTEFFERIVVDNGKSVLVYDHLNERDCWLPKYYKDGRDLISIEELTEGVEITMPMWLAEDRELV